ncbi:MAG: radical SAM protein [Bacteroidia bacterium]|nr:radical SAM protein [Bacteroidia bacterium]MDW8334807.1 radical SAM protein [Bacteroidia bacterium]
MKLFRVTLDTNPEDCNLHCIMCEEHSPYSDFIENLYRQTGVKRRRMPFEWVEKIVAQAAALGAREIIPSTMGEPLLYKGFERLFPLVQKHGMKVNLTTNGTFPKKSVEEWAHIIAPASSDVKISWNGATKATAEKVMLGIDFDRALDNVRKFIAVRNQYREACRVTFQLTFMRTNMHELAQIVRLAAELGVDRVKGHHLWAHFKDIEPLSMKASPESVALWNEYVVQAFEARERFLKPDGTKVVLENIWPLQAERPVRETDECPFLDKELWISATGKISPCCAPDKLRDSLGDFGNIESASLAEVLQSPAYRNLVENYKRHPLCQTCNMRRPADYAK